MDIETNTDFKFTSSMIEQFININNHLTPYQQSKLCNTFAYILQNH